MLERLAARRILWVVFMESGRATCVSIEHIHIDQAVGFMRNAVARASECTRRPSRRRS